MLTRVCTCTKSY